MTDYDFGTLASRFRLYARHQDAHRRAALDLLIWHEYWLRRRDFTRACVRNGVDGTSWVRWDQARAFLDADPRGSTSELAVLDLAVAIGEDRYKLSGMGGHAHAKAIVRAFAAALGEEAGDA